MALALRRRIRGSSVARTPINGPRRLASRSKCIPWPCVVVAVLLVLAINFWYNADKAKLFYEASHNLLDVHLKNLYQTHLPPHSQSLSRSGEEENVEIGTIIETQANSHSHPPILYGHVHMAKTGGTSLNGILANTFERVCGHKGYSYDAFQDNEREKRNKGRVKAQGRSRVFLNTMMEIGFEECDYISVETDWLFWNKTFGSFHGLRMELHVPCRHRIDHLMSQCNNIKKKIACDANTDTELIESVKKCFLFLSRYDHGLKKNFDVKCFDFKRQFTNYTNYMSGILQKRRFESKYVQRHTNLPRNKTDECIWENAPVLEKVDKYLLENIPYYQFCDKCMGSENEIALA